MGGFDVRGLGWDMCVYLALLTFGVRWMKV